MPDADRFARSIFRWLWHAAACQGGRLKCRLVNRHRRIEFEELMRYKEEQKRRSAAAFKRLNDLSQAMGEEL
jgi:hypothetical protein